MADSWELGEETHRARVGIPENLMNEGLFSVTRLVFLKDKSSVLFEERDVPRKEGVVRPKLEWSFCRSDDRRGPGAEPASREEVQWSWMW